MATPAKSPEGYVLPKPLPPVPARRLLAERALVLLLRQALAGRWGIRASRIYAVFVSFSITGTIWWISRRYGPDSTALSLLGRASALLTWIAGGIATLALAAPPKDPTLVQGVVALASGRGFARESIARAEMKATIRLLVEVIVVPIVAIGLFVFAFMAGGRLEGATRAILGSIAFGLLASIVLGVVAAGCRRWGGEQGRSWLLAVIFLPWFSGEMIAGGRLAPYLSIPGLLGRVWEFLTAAGS